LLYVAVPLYSALSLLEEYEQLVGKLQDVVETWRMRLESEADVSAEVYESLRVWRKRGAP
jgi:hypothetical protein